MDLTEQDKDIATESPEFEEDQESLQYVENFYINTNNNENDDDSQSNKSPDRNVASKPTELSETEQEQPEVAEPTVEPEGAPSEEFPHTCNTCKKTFRHATTLSRHQKIHLQDNQNEDGERKGRNYPALSSQPLDTSVSPIKEAEQDAQCAAAKEENSSIVESGTEEEEKEGQKEERNKEEESGSSELESAAGKPDKRKKICNVCSKRFWSLQDLTRHMRSHTGKNISV